MYIYIYINVHMLQCVAVCCSVLQRVYTQCSERGAIHPDLIDSKFVCLSVTRRTVLHVQTHNARHWF